MTQAATSTAWELTGYSDFLKGRFSGLSLSQDGTLQPGPSIRFSTSLGQSAVWSIAAGPDGSIYAGTGHTGKLIKVAPDGTSSVIWTAPQPEIFAIAVDGHGTVYAGTSPNGGLFRIEGGQAVEVWHSPEKYIWSLSPAPDGSIYAGTGEHGRVYRISSSGKADVFYETNQGNVTALALGEEGRLYAGTDPNGLLFEVSAQGRGTVLLDSTLPEIRAIVIGSDHAIYAAGMGGAVASRSAPAASSATPASTPVTAAAPTVITVNEAKDNAGTVDDQQNTLKVVPDVGRSTPSNVSGGTTAGTTTAVVEVSGVEKSSIYKINPNRSVETLRSSKEDNVYDLLADGDGLLISTDVRGRIYRLQGRSSTLEAELGDGEATRLLRAGQATYASMSNSGRLIALGPVGSGPGQFESPVHDSTSVARWGHIQFHGTGSDLTFRTRTGFSARPDSTWSAWSDPIPASGSVMIPSPPARFVQWRAEWPSGSSATVNTVDIPYLPHNNPPTIHSVTVSSVVNTNPAKSGSTSAASASTAYSITVTDTGDAPAASTANSASQTASRLQTTQTQISWQADDPDGDKLAYSVYFRSEEGTSWQLVRSRMFENTLLLDPDVFADGRYFFRVVATDSPSNPLDLAQGSEMVSTPVLIDNTPPEVEIGTPRRNGTDLDVDIKSRDKTSSLRLCEASLDAGSWQALEAVDGVTDSPQEQFHLHLEKLKPGEHLLVVRVYDAANNAGLAKIILH